MIERIVSGGQTGVDRGALDAALEIGMACGGWCPAGRRAEDGTIPPEYPLEETPTPHYAGRTRWNIRDSDGTLILHFGRLGSGTELTRRIAHETGKPLLIVNLAEADGGATATIHSWIRSQRVRVLNVAGPRESTAPGISQSARLLLRDLLKTMTPSSERKGARRMADIPAEVLEQLNAGTLETRTLAEGLAVNFYTLLGHALPARRKLPPEATLFAETGVTRRMAAAAAWLHSEFGLDHWDHFAGHSSDTVRGWAAYMLGASGLPLAKKLDRIRPLADDPHSGVREWAWIAIRPDVARDLPTALSRLRPWTSHASANMRRYASEITRPCGVWCAHLSELKSNPDAGRGILDPLHSDPAKYVQDSVANWLNDASKSRPDWVDEVCRDWLANSSTPATVRICRRALRTVRAKAK